VLLPGNHGEFSQLVRVHGKAFLAGEDRSLAKRNRAVRGWEQADPWGVSVPSRGWVPMFAQGTSIAGVSALAAIWHENAESVLITWKEH